MEEKIIIDDSILTRFILGKTSREESQQVVHSLETDQQIRDRYEILSDSIFHYDRYFVDKSVDLNRAKEVFLTATAQASKSPRKTQPATVFFLAAASVVLLVSLFFILQRDQTIELSAAQAVINEHPLPDGSAIWLNQNSTIRYEKTFGEESRIVYLQGEAFFDVQPNSNLPFVVKTEHVVIEVKGTSFAVNTRSSSTGEETLVIVEKGSIEVQHLTSKKSANLKAGEVLRCNASATYWAEESKEESNLLAWKTGILEFQGTKLSDVVGTLNEYYNTNIAIEDGELANLPLTSTFREEELDNVIEVIAFIHNLSVHHTDSTIVLTSKE